MEKICEKNYIGQGSNILSTRANAHHLDTVRKKKTDRPQLLHKLLNTVKHLKVVLTSKATIKNIQITVLN